MQLRPLTAARYRKNLHFARRHYPNLSRDVLARLRNISIQLPLLLESGELILLDGSWYVTHSGLLRVAALKRCAGIATMVQPKLSNPETGSWVFKAIVYKSRRSRGFIGYGDASPANVSPKVYGSEMRIAETRAANRALRKAYAIGICSYEELNLHAGDNNGTKLTTEPQVPTLRQRLCSLVEANGLNAAAVKRYAAQFCGTQEIREASRELVEDFVNHLSDSLINNRDALLAKLQPFETGGVQ